jgi:broad specificity phosphatase PhoE
LKSVVQKAHPDLFKFPIDFKSVGGENSAELLKRTQEALDRIIKENKDKGGNVLVVSHGITILNYVLGLDPKSWDIKKGGLPNSSVTTVEWKDGKFNVLKIGDESYAKKGEDMSKLTFYLVRHGETLFNKQGRIQGYSDSPLTQEGIEVAKNLGMGLKDVSFTAAYTSTSERAVDTANFIVNGRNLLLQTDKRLKEINFGDWEGALGKDILKDHPDFFTNPTIFQSVGGESTPEMVERLQAAMDLAIIENKGKGGNVLVVSHGFAILNYLMKLDPQSWDIKKGGLPNSSVTTVEWKDGKFKVIKIGDQSYAAKGKQLLKEAH